MKSIVAAKLALARGEVSSLELTKAYLAKIEKDESNAFILATPERALAQAKASDERRRKGDSLGALDGIPIAVKDLFCTEGIQTTAASAILAGFEPTYESTVTANLWAQGAVCLGKTNLDEFAMGSANITSHFGRVINPRSKDKPLAPGGSSGGSAAAVAADLALAAIGSDTGGSIRQPAAFCGVVGAKPTYGVCSRYGMVAFASSLDQAGPLTKTVADSALMLKAMASFDEKDSTSLAEKPNWQQEESVEGMKIGMPGEYQLAQLPGEINALWRQAAAKLKEHKATITEVSLPHTEYALPAYYIVAPAEASSNLARYDGVRYGLREEAETLEQMYRISREKGFGAEVTRRVLIGTYVLSAGYYDAYYLKASKVRRRILNDFEEAFAKVDALLTPTTPTAAFALDETQDFMTMYMNDVLTVPASMAGMPAISVPCGENGDGLPLGLQVIAPRLQEGRMFSVAAQLERLYPAARCI